MNEILKLICERHSSRVPFDAGRPLSGEDLTEILEAARWTPTAHNMQNFEIIVVKDKKVLEMIGNIKRPVSEDLHQGKLPAVVFFRRRADEKKNRNNGCYVSALLEKPRF